MTLARGRRLATWGRHWATFRADSPAPAAFLVDWHRLGAVARLANLNGGGRQTRPFDLRRGV